MNCQTGRTLLDSWRTGELDPERSGALTDHLVRCPACSGLLEEFRGIALRLGELRSAAPRSVLSFVAVAAADHYDLVQTEVGPVWVGFNARGVSMLLPAMGDASWFERSYRERRGRTSHPARIPEGYGEWVRQAASGTLRAVPKVDLEGLAAFERRVLALLPKIPRGEVRPYAWLARKAGSPAALRAVGNTMARNPIPLLLPCHRVVPTQGGVGNYAFGSEMKRELLEREGVPVGELEILARQGVRLLGCSSTRIFCLPTCRSLRRANPELRRPFRSAEAALAAGYRPCRHCAPWPEGREKAAG
jgi:O-6-methylguanine DNA methyltransferase